ncbi:MAG: acyl-ACP--UDP-N-acetylglucosamine O-acyltransferase [Marinicaulis sp.]|nr:acyl-ACP--UDP-N-acetylglucosamine O-acyltransferase [Marinicaulis sp.]NNL88865.1 acyl-ACP--UDP-N-acetylglucosamine O-acyltransferase [Marinicaulis sp.]
MKIHPTAIIEEGAELADDVSIGPYCFVGDGVKLGAGVTLKSHVVLEGDTTIGERTEIFPYATLGQGPQHQRFTGENTKLIVGADTIVREYVSMNRGTTGGGGVTKVGDGGFFMVGSNIAHDCQVGNGVILANNATVGGHVEIGDHAFLGGVCAIHQFTRIGDYAFVGGGAVVVADVIPYASAFGNRAHLAGLNIVGMKRRETPRDTIHKVRAAYKILFDVDGTMAERVERVREKYSQCSEVARILKFIDRDASRSLMLPER